MFQYTKKNPNSKIISQFRFATNIEPYIETDEWKPGISKTLI
jgi:hypothetical protein